MNRLDLKGLLINDRQGRLVVRAPDLLLRVHETTCLLGPSGSGKSLTALAILGLLPPELVESAGHLLIDGREVRVAERSSLRGRHIGMVFQEPRRALHPDFKVGTQLEEILRAGGGAAKDRKEAVHRWLERVGIADPQRRAADHPHRFSGGELQRIVLAMALCRSPSFLLADEPTSNLDVTVQARILGLLRRLQREEGLGLLLVTHDERVVAAMGGELQRINKVAAIP